MLHPHTRFSITVADYTRGRPSYPPALVDAVLALTPGRRVADLGCGTGLASRQFAAAGCDVVGIDPNAEMLAAAVSKGGARYLAGDATRTTLASGSVDLVIVAQAFHWFPVDAALAEIDRILAPGGAVAVFWNRRCKTPALRAYERLLRTYIRDYSRRPTSAPAIADLRARLPECRERHFRWQDHLDRDTFHARIRSASYVAHSAEPGFFETLDPLFHDYQIKGLFPFDYDTVLFTWHGRPIA